MNGNWKEGYNNQKYPFPMDGSISICYPCNLSPANDSVTYRSYSEDQEGLRILLEEGKS